MKSQGRISAGWSFTAGTFFGALAVFAVPVALHNSRAGAGTSDQRRPAAAESGDAARAPEARDFGAGASVEPAAAPRKAKPNATNTQRKLQGHSELDLQLD
jgi:hypothetical protein